MTPKATFQQLHHPGLGFLARKYMFTQAPGIYFHLPAGAAEGAQTHCGRCPLPAAGSLVPRLPAGCPGLREAVGPARFPPAAPLTSCPWRRRGGTGCPEPRRTASCWRLPEASGEVDRGGCRAVRQQGLNAPPARPPRPRSPRPGAPAPLHLTALGVRPSANRLPILQRRCQPLVLSCFARGWGPVAHRSFRGRCSPALPTHSPREPKAGSHTSQLYVTTRSVSRSCSCGAFLSGEVVAPTRTRN